MNWYTHKICSALLFSLIGVLVLACDTAHSVEPVGTDYFLKYYGEDGNQTAVDFLVNSDGSFIVLAKSNVGQGIFLIKVNAEGDILWQRKLGAPEDVPKDIEQTSDNSYLILSEFRRTASNIDLKLIKVNSEGQKTDSVTNGTVANDTGNSVTALTDGGFMIAGSTTYNPDPVTFPNRVSAFLHYRCDANLEFFNEASWSFFDGYGTKDGSQSLVNACTRIVQKPGTNEFYAFGYSNNKYFDNTDKIKLIYYGLSSEGASGLVVGFGATTEDITPSYVSLTPSSLLEGYFIVSTAAGSAGTKLHVSKLKYPLQFSTDNDRQFDQNIIGARNLVSVSATPSLTVPEGYLVVSNEMDVTGQTNVLLSKINQTGDEIWSVSLGGSGNDTAAAVYELSDGRIIVLATIQLDSQFKVALMKLNSKGQFLN